MAKQADMALIGLAVMGQNLVLNMNDKGYSVAVFNRTASTTDEFIKGPASGRTTIFPAHSLQELVDNTKKPRKIMLMVKAGDVVDKMIETLIPLLDTGDLIIDGGNSLYSDTARRTDYLEEKGLLYIGTGISGGEEGARNGPSIMPGGNPDAWPLIKDIFQAIAARTPADEPCCEWIGNKGAGHYVKMVHNGIEYGDMQLICEAYHILKNLAGCTYEEMHAIFDDWNKGDLSSYLVEITRDIMAFKDTDNTPLIEKILDRAGQKGTGKWTGISSLELGVPVTLISEAVYSRCLSSLKEERVTASKILPEAHWSFSGEKEAIIQDTQKALLAAKIISYAQGFMLLKAAAAAFGWKIDFGNIAKVWQGGCIIRSVFLSRITRAYREDPQLTNMILHPYFKDLTGKCIPSLRKVLCHAVSCGIPVPAFSTALSFYDGYRSAWLPANLIQALRDYFGAHTYERTDRGKGLFFHTNWTGKGGTKASGVYTV
ncbi:MAG: decarboxylating NADP(+)-dependent phosphogluconate dehydrogenase [Spirochaetales bacterium]|nr:decarboxylating NADP(+)-dependent phosphogluconate dehydrogenase [Spirochaetales bacterium]